MTGVQTCALPIWIAWPRIFGEAEEERQEAVVEAAPKMKVLTDEDEAEVERLYQQLRTAGRFNDQDK